MYVTTWPEKEEAATKKQVGWRGGANDCKKPREHEYDSRKFHDGQTTTDVKNQFDVDLNNWNSINGKQ